LGLRVQRFGGGVTDLLAFDDGCLGERRRSGKDCPRRIAAIREAFFISFSVGPLGERQGRREKCCAGGQMRKPEGETTGSKIAGCPRSNRP